MKKIFYRIKTSMFSTLPKQLLKVLFFCILFSMLLSTFTISRLCDYFVKFISEKIDLTININTIVCSNEYISSVDFINDRESTKEYLENSLYYINTVKSIADNNNCDYYLTINCEVITSSNNKNERLLNVSDDYFDQDSSISVDSFEQFACLAINQSLFNKLRQDNYQSDKANLCILQEGAKIATPTQDGSYQMKPVKIGDVINLSYIIGWTGSSYIGGQGEKSSKNIEFTVVGFANEETGYSNDVSVMYISLDSFLGIIQDVTTQFNNNQQLNIFMPYQANEAKIYCSNLQQYISIMNQLNNNKDNSIYYNTNSSELAQLISLTSAISTNIKDFLLIIIILTIITTAINSLLTIYMKRKEIGLLYSFGERKIDICLQIIIEQVIIIFISVPTSLLIQKFISQKIIAYLAINNSLETETLKSFFSQRILLQTNVNDYIGLLILSILIICIYSLIVSITISKNDPKELLKG